MQPGEQTPEKEKEMKGDMYLEITLPPAWEKYEADSLSHTCLLVGGEWNNDHI